MRYLTSIFYIFFFVLSSNAFAAEGHISNVTDWVWRLVNFTILVIILIKFTGKPLREFLRKRTELIEKSLKESAEAKELAMKALSEVEKRLETKDKEIEEILNYARRSGENERESIIKQGEALKVKLLEQAKTNIELELKTATDSLKAEAVELSLELAEKRIREGLTNEQKEKLLEDYIKRLEVRN